MYYNATNATNATNAGNLTGNPHISVSSINTNNNNINAGTGTITAANIYSDTWRKSNSVLHVYRESNWGSGSRFVIGTNLLISEYYRPGVQWRWMFGVSSGDDNSFVWGFFCAMYDQNRNSFNVHAISGGGNISVYQNWDGSGWNRCVIDVNVGNPPNYLNVNIY